MLKFSSLLYFLNFNRKKSQFAIIISTGGSTVTFTMMVLLFDLVLLIWEWKVDIIMTRDELALQFQNCLITISYNDIFFFWINMMIEAFL